jgi:hypothetical protein
MIDHGCGDGRSLSKAVREVRSDIEFATTDMDLALGCFSKWNDAGIEAVYDRSECEYIDGPLVGDGESCISGCHQRLNSGREGSGYKGQSIHFAKGYVTIAHLGACPDRDILPLGLQGSNEARSLRG